MMVYFNKFGNQSSGLNKLLIIFILLFSFCISIGYSALNASVSVTGDLVYRVSADIRITGVKISSVTNGGLEQYSPKYTKDTASIGLKLPHMYSTVTYEVTVTNKSSKRKRISAITNKVEGDTSISYTYDYKLNTAIAANSSIKILFTYEYSSIASQTPNAIKENTISFTFADAYPLLYDRIQTLSSTSSNYIQKYTGDTSTFTGTKSIYYYYGAAENNNVLFANYCWKIVRTTDTGGVKLLYNGVPSSGSCNNTGDASQLTAAQMNLSSNSVAFNSDYKSLADVGYMYNKRYEYKRISTSSIGTVLYGNSFTYANGTYTLANTKSANISNDYNDLSNYHYTCFNTTGTCTTVSYVFYYYISDLSVYYIDLKEGNPVKKALNEMLYNSDINKTNSTLKTAIDYWYSENMTSYTGVLEDTVWCNDRSTTIPQSQNHNGWNPNGGIMYVEFVFNPYGNTSNLTCVNKNDRFTKYSENGNGALTYPAGLITRQEAELAYSSSESPLASGNIYWTLSPYSFDNSSGGLTLYASDYVVGALGYPSDLTVRLARGVRPAVSLRSGIEYSVGDGTTDNPYVILTD